MQSNNAFYSGNQNCEFNTDYEPLLQDIVNYAIENYGNNLNISTLTEIELADKELFPYETEGKLASKEKIFFRLTAYTSII